MENIPRNIIELDPASDNQDFYILGPAPKKQKPPFIFTPSQTETTVRPNTFTAQDAGIYFGSILESFLFFKTPRYYITTFRKRS